MIRLILFSFVVLMQAVKAADGGLVVTLTDNYGNTLTTSLQAKEDYLQVPTHHLIMAKNALPLRIEKIMQQEDLSKISKQELECIHDYLEREKDKDREQWIKEHDCNINCGLFSSIVGSYSLATLGAYLCAESVGLEMSENKDVSKGVALGLLPIAGYAGCKFAQYYQPDQSEISHKIDRVWQALRNKQKQD